MAIGGTGFDFTFIFCIFFADTFFLVLKFILSIEGEFESVFYSYIIFFSFKTLGFLQCTLYKYLIIDGKNIFKYLWEMRESKNGYLRPWNHVSNCNKLQRNQRKIQSHTWDLFSINLLKESPLIIHPFFKSVKNFISQNIGENYTASKKDFRSETDSSL